MSFEDCLNSTEDLLKRGVASIIDLPAGEAAPLVAPIMDHVAFVYGIDDRYLYVIDSWQLPCFEYEKILPEPEKFLMRFPLDKVKERWEKGGMLWVFEKKAAQ